MTENNTLTIALSKGRIFEETLPLLAAAGIVPAEAPEKSRKLIIGTNHENIRLVIVRATVRIAVNGGIVGVRGLGGCCSIDSILLGLPSFHI